MEAALAWVPYEKKHEVDACEKGMDGLESHFAVGLPESRFRPRIFRRRSVGPLTPARRLLPAIRGNEASSLLFSSSFSDSHSSIVSKHHYASPDPYTDHLGHQHRCRSPQAPRPPCRTRDERFPRSRCERCESTHPHSFLLSAIPED